MAARSGRVTVLEAGPSLEGSVDAVVLLKPEDFPGLYVEVLLDERGQAVGWTVADWRFLRRVGEPAEDDPTWGPVRNVTSRLMRQLPFGEFERVARSRLEHVLQSIADDDTLDRKDRRRIAKYRTTIGAVDSAGQGKKTRYGDDHYARVAREYVRALASADPTRVVALLPQYVVSPKTVRNWLVEARDRGLLTEPPSPGKAGGQLTAKARKILRGGSAGNGKS